MYLLLVVEIFQHKFVQGFEEGQLELGVSGKSSVQTSQVAKVVAVLGYENDEIRLLKK